MIGAPSKKHKLLQFVVLEQFSYVTEEEEFLQKILLIGLDNVSMEAIRRPTADPSSSQLSSSFVNSERVMLAQHSVLLSAAVG